MATNARPVDSENWETQIRKGWLELAILCSLWADKLYGLTRTFSSPKARSTRFLAG